jgi:hypothetical protein
MDKPVRWWQVCGHFCHLFTCAQQWSTNENTEQMYPLSEKLHPMETKTPQKFEVQYAKTDRLKNCAKPVEWSMTSP